jgi:hypothetical protein
MYNIELYETIVKGDIQNSLYIATSILLSNQLTIEIFENTLIAVCSYIGTFINIYDVSKWLDVISGTRNIVENDNINIKYIYVILTKMCILCDKYIKSPISKAGIINLKTLRTKIIDVFENNDNKLSSNGIMKFDGIIPPHDSETYNISLQIISGIVKLIKLSEDVSCDDGDYLQEISNKLRNCFDYISRKTYTFETKFYNSDNDSIWFLWGFISILYNDKYINDTFFLFANNWKKKSKNYKIGLLYGTGVSIIYSHKKNISPLWNSNESSIINKISEISLTLFNEIKEKISQEKGTNIINDGDDTESNIKEYEIDGLDYLCSYVPTLSLEEKMLPIRYENDNTMKQINCKYKNNY